MKTRSGLKLTTAFLLAAGLAGACGSNAPKEEGGSGGNEEETGGSGGVAAGGQSGSGTGGSGGSGGLATGGSGGSGGSGGGAGGVAGSNGGGAGGGGTGGTASGGSGGNSSVDAGGADVGGPNTNTDGPPATGGALTITVDHDLAKSTPMRLCFKAEASNSGGNVAPKVDWTGVPAEAKSLVLSMRDIAGSNQHMVMCNIPTNVTGMPANFKAMLPPGASVGWGNGKKAWYGPGAGGAARNYEWRIWALKTAMLEGGCASAADSYKALAAKEKDPSVVIAFAAQTLWGNVAGECK